MNGFAGSRRVCAALGLAAIAAAALWPTSISAAQVPADVPPGQMGLVMFERYASDFGKRPILAGMKIAVADMARTVRFYTDVFGMKRIAVVITRPPKPPSVHETMMRFAGANDTWLTLVQAPPGAQLAAYGQLTVMMPDARATLERAGGGIPDHARGERQSGEGPPDRPTPGS